MGGTWELLNAGQSFRKMEGGWEGEVIMETAGTGTWLGGSQVAQELERGRAGLSQQAL